MIIERHLGTDQSPEVQQSMINCSHIQIGLILRCRLGHHCLSWIIAIIVVGNECSRRFGVRGEKIYSFLLRLSLLLQHGPAQPLPPVPPCVLWSYRLPWSHTETPSGIDPSTKESSLVGSANTEFRSLQAHLCLWSQRGSCSWSLCPLVAPFLLNASTLGSERIVKKRRKQDGNCSPWKTEAFIIHYHYSHHHCFSARRAKLFPPWHSHCITPLENPLEPSWKKHSAKEDHMAVLH